MLMKKTQKNGCKVKCVNLVHHTTDANINDDQKRRAEEEKGESASAC
jgi:hypothetical protein